MSRLAFFFFFWLLELELYLFSVCLGFFRSLLIMQFVFGIDLNKVNKLFPLTVATMIGNLCMWTIEIHSLLDEKQ